MAKSLKEALLEKFADLQQLGIAPTMAPPLDDDGPAVVVEMGSDSYGDSGGRRQRSNRGLGGYDDDMRRGGDMPIRPRSGRRGGPPGGGDRGRGDRGRGAPGGDRFRRPERGGDRPMPADALTGPMPNVGPRPGPRPPFGDRPPGPRPPFGDRPPGPRPPFGDRPAGPRPPMGDRPMGPRPGGPPQMGTTDRLRQRAEQRQREEKIREDLQAVVASITGAEATPEVLDKFFADLTVETGALPPIDRVLEAVKLANSIEPAKVGNAVRQLFRRPRPRPAGAPGQGPAPAPRPAPAVAPTPEPSATPS